MALSHPYVIYGTIKQEGVAQSGATVTVLNSTTSETHDVSTDASGYYNVTITRTDWYASGASNGDVINVTALTKTRSVTVNDTAYPWGIEASIDLYVRVTTYATDVLLKKLDVTTAFGADAALKKQDIPLAFAVDAALKKLDITTSMSLDAVLKKLDAEKYVNVDVLISQTKCTCLDISTVLRKSIEKVLWLDAILKGTLTLQFELDTIFKKTLTKVFIVDLLIAKSFTKTFNLDGIFKKQNATQPFNVDVMLNEATKKTRTLNVDTILKKLNAEKYVNVDALLRQTKASCFDISSVQKILKTLNFNVDSTFLKTELASFFVDVCVGYKLMLLSFNIDTLFVAAKTANLWLDEILVAADKLASPLYIDCVFKKKDTTLPFNVDAVFGTTFYKTFLLDAMFALADAYEVAFAADTAFRQTVLTTLLMDSVFSLAGLSKYFMVDNIIQKLYTLPFNVDNVFKGYPTRGFAVDVYTGIVILKFKIKIKIGDYNPIRIEETAYSYMKIVEADFKPIKIECVNV